MSEIPAKLAVPPLASVLARLARLRWQVVAGLWVAGLARIFWLTLALVAVDFTLDWIFRLDRAQRAVLLSLATGATALGAYRWLFRPLSRSLGDEVLAMEVERVHPRLRQSLITALQLATQDGANRRGMSPQLVSRAIAQGAKLAEEIRFDSVLNGSERTHNALLLSVAVILFAGLSAASVVASPLRTWFARNVLLRHVNWPQSTYLVIENARPDGTVLYPRGGNWTQFVSVRDDSLVRPIKVYLDTQTKAGLTSRQLDPEGDGHFSTAFTNIVEPFQFRARGGDEITDWFQVELAEPPELTTLKLLVTPPHYAGPQLETLAPGQGPYALLSGSALRLVATANQPLARATLVGEGRPLGSAEDQETTTTFDLTIGTSGELQINVPANALLSGNYHLELETPSRFREHQPIRFALGRRTDQPPRVNAQLPVTRGMVTPVALVPFECVVTDDFGLTSVTAHLRWQSQDGQTHGETTLDFDSEARDTLVPVGENAPIRDLQFATALDLALLELIPGASLQCTFLARDNDNISGPNTGHSAELLLRVVTKEELRAELLRREKELRQEFEQAVKDQDVVLVETRALAASLADRQSAAPDPRSELANLHRQQQDLGRTTAKVADRFASILHEVQNNRLDDDNRFQSRLVNDIIDPLRQVSDKTIAAALQELDKARWETEGDPRSTALKAAIEQQQHASAAMRAILRQMVESETFQEAVNMLYEIQKAQAEVNDQTNKAREEKVKRLLEGERGASVP